MIPETIRLRECLDHLESGQTFSFSAFTLNEQKGTGGQLLEYREAQWLKQSPPAPNGGVTGEVNKPLALPVESMVSKNPNHSFHSTRNVRILADGHPTNLIIKIHIDLMVVFNDRKVILP